MKLSKLALVAAIACGTYAGDVFADQTNEIQLVSCDCGEPACGCESVCDSDECCDSGCDGGCDSCGSGCGLSLGDCGLGDCLSCGDCCLGDPYTLFGECCGWSAGGWAQLGYFNKGSSSRFNSYSDNLQLQQGWLWAEKALDTRCGFDWGGRVDYVYGTDGPDTQAFGQSNGWDTGWTNGANYGSALPQFYGEVGYGDVSVKAGHFFTIIGYEVVPATGNFFYSHAYTMYNSEPFTHTGALATYHANDNIDVWGGYVLGWDSGFEDNGDAWLGGASLGLTDDLTVIYASVAGRFDEGTNLGGLNERGYMQSVILDYNVTDDLEYIFQCDWLDTEDAFGDNSRDTIGVNQYLIKTVNDCLAVGARFEWWGVKNGADTSRRDVYDLTFGVNYRPHANLVFRPEVRWDWDEDRVVGLEGGDDQASFAIDGILTF